MTRPESLVDLLDLRAERSPDAVAFTQWADGLAGSRSLRYGELHADAARVAGFVARHTSPGDRVVLVVLDQLAFLTAFLGVGLAGRVPVPASAPTGPSGLHRLSLMIEDCGAALVLLDPLFAGLVGQVPQISQWAPSARSVADALAHDPLVARPVVPANAIAFLQYTSGSTSAPRGVQVSHANVLANQRLITEALGHDDTTVIASWLPSFHDMGLIGGLLQPLHLGVVGHLMTPAQFLARPLDWLRLIYRTGATTSGSPNFGYELCLRRTTEQDRAELDLGRWRIAFNGAEPVAAATLQRFAAAFAVAGFRESALFPCYGLAEATLFVTGGRPGGGAVVRDFDRVALESGSAVPVPAVPSDPVTALVSSGRDPHGLVTIADPRPDDPDGSRPDAVTGLPDGTVGEIVVGGNGVTAGYWRNPDATSRVFHLDGDGPRVRTGDLGFLLDGELYVVGRLRDLIIVRGRNLHPQDIEAVVAGAGFPLRRAGVVAVGHERPDGDTGVVVIAETTADGPHPWVQDLRERVAHECDVQVGTVVLCAPGSLPRTTSGKKQRSLTRRRWLAGELDVRHEDVLPDRATSVPSDSSAAGPRDLRALVDAALGIDADVLPGDVPLVALGLDSVGAAAVALAAREELGLDLAPGDLLEARGLDDLLQAPSGVPTDAVSDTTPDAAGGPGTVGSGTAAVGRAAVSHEVFLAHALRFPDDPAYTMVRLVEVVAATAGQVCAVVDELVRRHPVLRTRFAADGRDHVLVDVEPPPARPRRMPDVAAVRAWAGDAAADPIDLTTGPGARLLVAVTDDGRVFLLAVSHHATVDLWSLVRLVGELGALLARPDGAAAHHLPRVGAGVARHAAAQRALLAEDGPHWAQQWRERLAGAALLALPSGTGGEPSYGCVPVVADAAVRDRVLTAARTHGVTPFVVLLACVQRLLARYAGTDDVTVAVPFHGRTHPDWRHDVGGFATALPVRVVGGPDLDLDELIDRARAAVADARQRQDLPLGALGIRLPRGPRATLATQVGFVLQGFADPAERALAPLAVPGAAGTATLPGGAPTLVVDPVPRRRLDAELVLTLVDTGTELRGALEFDPAAVAAAWAHDLATHLGPTLNTLLADAPTPTPATAEGEVATRGEDATMGEGVPRPIEAGEGPPRSGHEPAGAMGEGVPRSMEAGEGRPRSGALGAEPNEPSQFVEIGGFGGSGAVVAGPVRPVPEPVPAVVLRLAEEDPERPAVECGGHVLTRGELVSTARVHAATLRAAGVGPGDVAGVHLPASHARVPWVLAVWLAGGIYLPLDVSQPVDRLVEILGSARCTRVVTDADPGWELPDLRLIPGSPENPQNTENPDPGTDHPCRADDAGYLIFTSGTSGRPKGVVLEHGGLANVAGEQARWFGLGSDDRVLAYTAHSFDAAVFELVLALTSGAVLVVPTPQEREVDQLALTLRRRGVTAAVLTPSVAARLPDTVALPQLRALMLAGEELPTRLAERWAARTALFNLYGPTECTIWCTAVRLHPGDAVTIGGPIANTVLAVVDDRGRPLPLPRYAVGELVVSGVGVGRGYLDRDGTAFTSDEDGHRRYRTGDRVRLRGDELLEYLGRADGQVKVRGVRVELREVEHRLRALPEVADAHCLAVTGHAAPDDTTIAAAVRPVPGTSVDPGTLRDRLRRVLPPAMVPARIVLVDAIPFDRHGKVDREALLATVDRDVPAQAGPLTPFAARVAGVVADVIGRSVADAEADLAELGVTSVEAAHLAGRLRAELHRAVAVADLYEHPTVRLLARHLEGLPAPDEPPPDDGARVLAPTQREILLAHRLGRDGTAYHVPLLLAVEGAVDPAALAEAVRLVVLDRPALRSGLREPEGSETDSRNTDADGVDVVVHDEVGEVFRHVDLRSDPDPDARAHELAATAAATPFDLVGSGPLRVLLLHTATDRWLLSVVAHHGFVDGWSLGVVLDDVSDAYAALVGGSTWTPAPEGAVVLVAARPEEWAALDWPRTGPLPLHGGRTGPRATAVLERVLAAPSGRGPVAAARAAGVPTFALALAVWSVVLGRRSGHRHLVTATVLAGRDAATHRTVGCLAGTVPLPVRLDRGRSWEELAQHVAGLLRRAGRGSPGVAAVAAAAGLGSAARSGLMQTLFVQGDSRFWSLDLVGCRVVRLPSAPPVPKSELAVTFVAADDGCRVALEYDRGLFPEPNATALLDQFEALLAEAAHDLDAGIDRPVAGRARRRATRTTGAGLWARFLDLGREDGSAPALVDEHGRTWTRAELAALVSDPAPGAAGAVATLAEVLGTWSAGGAVDVHGRPVDLDVGDPPLAAALRLDVPGGVRWLTHADLGARLDRLTAALGGRAWRLVGQCDRDAGPILGLVWPIIAGAVAELSAKPAYRPGTTAVRLVSSPAGRPRPTEGPTVLVVTGYATAVWCAEAARQPDRSVLRVWAPDGVPLARWPDPASRVALPTPDVELDVVGEAGLPVADHGFGEVVVRPVDGAQAPWSTGTRGRRLPDAVECHATPVGVGPDLVVIEDALVRAEVAPLAVAVGVAAGPGVRVCFVVAAGDPPDADALLHRVAEVLDPAPAPDRLVLVPALPTDPDGAARLLLDSEPPQPWLPDVLAAWVEVVGTPPPSPDVSFFDAGGTSALALRLSTALRRRTGREVPLAWIFEFATARRLAQHLAARATGPAPGTTGGTPGPSSGAASRPTGPSDEPVSGANRPGGADPGRLARLRARRSGHPGHPGHLGGVAP